MKKSYKKFLIIFLIWVVLFYATADFGYCEEYKCERQEHIESQMYYPYYPTPSSVSVSASAGASPWTSTTTLPPMP